jgi:hypothetical protein
VPQISGLRRAITGEPGAVIDATGGQYEGYNYLGAGVLLVLAAAALAWAFARRGRRAEGRGAALPLVLALAGLTALALSNRVYVGHVQVLSTVAPGRRFLDELRSSGRMFWPVAYGLLVLAFIALDRVPRRALAAAVLAAAVALQVLDTSVLRGGVESTYARIPGPPGPSLAPWNPGGALAGRDLRFLPRFLCATHDDEDVMRAVSLAALRTGSRIEGGPEARMRPEACAEDQFAAVGQEPAGQVAVLMARSLSAPTLLIASQVGRCLPLAFGEACGSDLPSAGEAALSASLTPVRDGERIGFTAKGDGRSVEGPGWSGPEAFGTWTEGKHAFLLFMFPSDWTGGAMVTVQASAFTPPPRSGQAVTVLANNHPVAHWDVGDTEGSFEADLPRDLWTGNTVMLELAIPGAISPFAATKAPDYRVLGINVRSLTVRAAERP